LEMLGVFGRAARVSDDGHGVERESHLV